jgi:uncharacterized alkaline shock family protein YloU
MSLKMREDMQIEAKTTIAPDVLVTIAKLNTLSVEGVSRLAAFPGSMDRLFKKSMPDGVRIMVENDTVYVDIFVILSGDHNARDVSRNIQNRVVRAISEMVGMEVGRVNIHIEDLDFNQEVLS